MRSHPSSPGDEKNRRLLLQQVAQLATYAFDVPVALAHVNEEMAGATREEGAALAPADLQAIVERIGPIEAPLVIEDTVEDDRLTPEGTSVRFVAAVPVRGGRRQRIGALSIADTSPRSFSEVDVEHLRTLVALVVEAYLYPLEGMGPGPSLQHIVQQVDHGIVVTDASGRIAWVNKGFEQLCGYTREELHGRKPKELLHGPRTDPDVLATMRSHVQAGTGFSTEVVNYRKSGEPYWVRIQAEPIEVAGTLTGFIGFETDISAQKDEEETLQMERDLLAAAVDTVEALIVLLDPEARIVRFSEGCRRVTGYEVMEVVGEPMVDLYVPEEEHARVRTALEAHRAGQSHSTFTCHWITKDGERRLINWSNTAFTDAQGTVRRIISTGIDITEQRQLEAYALQVSDAERQRIGNALHDLLASQLMGTAMMAKGLAQQLDREQTVAGEELHAIVEQIQQAAHRVRALSHTLVPERLRGRSLEDALRQLGAREEERTGVRIHVDVDPDFPPMEEADAVALYRMAYEAIGDALRYGGTGRVGVHLAVEEGRAVLVVRDDGARPTDPEAVKERDVWIRLMHRRAEAIGAELSVERAEQGGTVVRYVLRADAPAEPG